MLKKNLRFRIGLRTIKTAVAVVISLIVVNFYGATTSKLVFAMLGAMEAMQPTFKDSIRSCCTQIVGVLFGAVMGILLSNLPIHPLAALGIGIILVITLYNALQIRFSPGLPCLIVVTICTTPDIQPLVYATGRIWDSAIGLGVGMIINTLVFPYDNSRQIHATVESLDRVLIEYLEDMFDGDNTMPDAALMECTVQDMARQLSIFSNQRLLMRRSRQKKQIASFQVCEGKARELLARMEVLSHMEKPGRLSKENRRKLRSCGAQIADSQGGGAIKERDIVTNYHVTQILKLRRELLEALGENTSDR